MGNPKECRDLQSWSSLFQPDILATNRYYDRWRRRRCLDPERRLMLAILEDAVECYRKYSSTRTAGAKAALGELVQWFHNEKSDRLYAFENVCEVLGLDPNYVRTGLTHRQKQRRLTRHYFRVPGQVGPDYRRRKGVWDRHSLELAYSKDAHDQPRRAKRAR